MPAFRLYPDPEDQCVSCAGYACRPFFDADTDWHWEACGACLGIASAGCFVLQLHVGEMIFEQSWQSTSFQIARARGSRWAYLLRAYAARANRDAEVRVVFKPIETHESEEVVERFNVFVPRLKPVAA